MVNDNKKVSCFSPPCKYYLVYNCFCQQPRCRVESPAFQNNGLNCNHHKVKLLEDSDP